jgi:hypothetical protein
MISYRLVADEAGNGTEELRGMCAVAIGVVTTNVILTGGTDRAIRRVARPDPHRAAGPPTWTRSPAPSAVS